MSKERCADCIRTFSQIKTDHPDWSEKDRNDLAINTFRAVSQKIQCFKIRKCVPMAQALQTNFDIRKQERSDQQEQNLPVVKQAREVVDLHIQDQVFGHPDKYTAYSHKKNCGCPDSQREYDEWKRLWGK